ncbi:MAG: 50S ribosomal protein L25/general stress protein Ctc [Hydrogenophaga sp.]|jgi:large subunit ribosomal protein L25|nr:50S ribosomal protein L25/general stress protein Ctc [Hydrogenophaga sp.]
MQFVAFERNKQGTGASRRLRNTGRAPGIVFGGASAPVTIEIDHNALWHALKKEAFHASLLDMELAGKTEKVILRDVQYHPFKQLVLHVDFQRVDAKTRLHKKVPLHFVGAEQSPAVKEDKCVVNHVMTEIEIECLATQLPENITVDLSQATKGASIHVSHLQLPAGVKVVTHGRGDLTIVSMVAPVEELIAAPEAAAPVDPKAKGKGKK